MLNQDTAYSMMLVGTNKTESKTNLFFGRKLNRYYFKNSIPFTQ